MKQIDEDLRERFKLYKDFSIPPKEEWEKIVIKIQKIQRLNQKARLTPTSNEILPKPNSM
jgi:MoxR-like ATPase